MRKQKQKKVYSTFAAIGALTFILAAYYYLPVMVRFRGAYFAMRHRVSKTLGLSIYRLPVKYHRQEHSLSCEIAALKMALSGVGVEVSENELIKKLKFDPTPKGRGIWGDPYTGFVGAIDGKMGRSGYGVYWQPVHEVAKEYANSEVIENASPGDLARHLSEGKPIVWWGYFGRGRKLSWTTPEGKKIEAIDGEHARTLVGFAGNINDPDGFFIFDPIYGEMYWSTTELMENSKPFNNSGIVVDNFKF